MSYPVTRRNFLSTGTAVGATVLAGAAHADDKAPETVTIGVMGLSRGLSLCKTFGTQPGVRLKYVCDVDEKRALSGKKAVEAATDQTPEAITDFRQILDDPEVDALVVAAPNHWHAPATILGCKAGKHVYVEKPCSHNPAEGELMIEAARKYNRAVQLGTQRRSVPSIIEAIQKLHDGAIGDAYLARCWYANLRGSIGHGKPADPPANLNYDLWQGPAPRTPYVDNRIHYNWHWFWQWGNGELGNNGVHTLDLGRWGLGVEYPQRVTSSGGRYHWEDDQQTPDTHVVAFEFDGGKQMTWQGLSCNRHNQGFVEFHGTEGSMEIDASGTYRIYDRKDKVLEEVKARMSDSNHINNFLTAIREDKPLSCNAEILEGHRSTLLCHLGNIAHRTGRSLTCSSKDGRIIGDEQAMKYWQRDYEPGWEPTV
ncbi:Gfo/Idh/MocA family oxidoreductase [Maioricimonas sp. JC845]|uniref:Gfo/Idh/MocA family protein n=1 Tax=Maioricimonas sp. JC845 TaxID=3232138 RepID=UPI0034574D3C